MVAFIAQGAICAAGVPSNIVKWGEGPFAERDNYGWRQPLAVKFRCKGTKKNAVTQIMTAFWQ